MPPVNTQLVNKIMTSSQGSLKHHWKYHSGDQLWSMAMLDQHQTSLETHAGVGQTFSTGNVIIWLEFCVRTSSYTLLYKAHMCRAVFPEAFWDVESAP